MSRSDSDDTDATDAASLGAAARRSPVQGRSQETVQRILTATSQLLADGVRLEEITTVQIAKQAGVSVGALYRFFRDKQKIIDAIAARHMDDFQLVLIAQLATRPLTDGPAFLNAIIDAFAAFMDERPDFRAIAFGGRHISAETRNRLSGPDTGGSAFLKQFMVEGLGINPSPDLDFRIRIAAELGGSLLAYAFEQDSLDERQRVIDELKSLLADYFFERKRS